MENHEVIKSKIYNWDELQKQLAVWRFKDKKIVFTNGCFDVIHLGHIEYLAKSRDLGNILVVGLNSDESVRRLKGSHRPMNNEDARATILSALFFVDAVIVFGEDTPAEIIELIRPDILVKGKDYEGKEIVGSETVKSYGGEVVMIDLTKGYSSTHIIEKMHK
jgi:rfaE bifunctional protein nucleotidyltransferase chain/domain